MVTLEELQSFTAQVEEHIKRTVTNYQNIM